MTTDKLIDLLRERCESGLRVSAITIERSGAGWQARVSYANFAGSPELDDNVPGHVVTVDTEDLPPGVSARTLNRWPDELIALDGIGSDEQAEAAIAAVSKAGAAPDYAGFGDPPARRWLTKPTAWGVTGTARAV